ncbi:MAG: hypothetical protein OEY56_09820, partial [Cyclobacteriaceae bacterium]|nr:hypothetical protein [Cyclobacteriaceae bacterium]
MKKLVNKALVVLGLCTSYLLAAQQPDGWIQFNQNYIKLKVTQDNYYRVTSAELQAAGYPTTSVAVSQLKLYRRGNEVNIRTVANADGVTLSYLEFWGEKNDGKTDTDLYLPAAQPHQAYNLFTDTATYFLTWSSTTSTRRIVPSGINNNTGLIPEAYHLARERILQTSVYSPGRQFGPGSVQKLSDYDAGEGFTGAFLSKNSAQTFTFTLTDRVIGSVNPHVEAVIVGGNSLTHRVQVEAGPDATSLVTIDTLTFDGYTHFNYQKEIPASRVGITGSLLIRFKALGIADAADRVSLALVDVVYPQQLVVPVSGQKIFTLEKNSVDRSYIRMGAPTPSAWEFFDVTVPEAVYKVTQNNLTSRVDLVITPTANLHRKIVAVQAPATVAGLAAHRFNRINVTGKQYLIVTHRALRTPVGGQDPILAYQQYRESSAGGSYPVLVAEIHDV